MTFIPEPGMTDPALRRDNVLGFVASVAIRINEKLAERQGMPSERSGVNAASAAPAMTSASPVASARKGRR